jgi:hypothetical protein
VLAEWEWDAEQASLKEPLIAAAPSASAAAGAASQALDSQSKALITAPVASNIRPPLYREFLYACYLIYVMRSRLHWRLWSCLCISHMLGLNIMLCFACSNTVREGLPAHVAHFWCL